MKTFIRRGMNFLPDDADEEKRQEEQDERTKALSEVVNMYGEGRIVGESDAEYAYRMKKHKRGSILND